MNSAGNGIGPFRALGLLAAACLAPAAAAGQGLELAAELVANGLIRPVALVAPDDGSGRLLVAEQTGAIRIVRDGVVEPQPFLDLSSEIGCCGELGLLGLVLHPDFAANGSFYVAYTELAANAAGARDLLVVRFSVSADPDLADAASGLLLLRVVQPFTNHNGGHLAFGPDGYLYIGSGDGGSGGDPLDRGQALDTLLGKILRIDVDGADPGRAYAVPADNPFAGDALAGCAESCPAGPCGDTCDEIWVYGLRNPWRFGFDPANGDLYIGDVGQFAWEEVDYQPAGSLGGENYGWRRMEGGHCYNPPSECNDGSLSLPVLEYSHDVGCSITGGEVYRGAGHPRLDGVYLYADYCTGLVSGTVPRCDGAWESRTLVDLPFLVSSFGRDTGDEVYVLDYDLSDGAVYRLGLSASSGGPALRVDPQPIDFGSLPPGGPATLELLLTNENTGPEALRVSEVAVVGGDGAFALDPAGGSDPCSSIGPCLPPGASCTMELLFSSSQQSWHLATLTGAGNTQPVAVAAGACTAAAVVTLDGTEVTGDAVYDACDRLEVGPDFTVAASGSVLLRAGNSIGFADGTTVAGELTAVSGLP